MSAAPTNTNPTTEDTATAASGRIDPHTEAFLRAAQAGNVEEVTTMLKDLPDLINMRDGGGYSALHLVAHQGNVKMIDALAAFKPNLDIQNVDQNTPMMLAAKVQKHDAIRRLAELGANVNMEGGEKGHTAAHYAAAMGHMDTIRVLVALGANVTKSTNAGTILHWACYSGAIEVVGPIVYDFGIDINSRDPHGATPLHVATHLKKTELVEFFLERGAEVGAVDGDKQTPLHMAAEQLSIDNVKMLMVYGADAAAKDAKGMSAAEIAMTKKSDALLKELSKPQPTKEKKAEDAARFKAQGNKVFMKGEHVKASKFYALAIVNDPSNHVFFSNRSACWFNMRQYAQALYDAKQCIKLAPQWPKGYFRLAATLKAMKQNAEASEAIAAGLKLDANNADLKALQAELCK